MGGPWGHYAEWNKLDKDTVWSHLYVEFKIKQKKLTDAENRLEIARRVCVCGGGWQMDKGGQKVKL